MNYSTHSSVDGDNYYGDISGLIRRMNVGGIWASTHSGSRSGQCFCLPPVFGSDLATRGCKFNFIILGRK